MSSTDASTSRKLKRLWVSLALAAVVLLCAPFIEMLAGFPPFGLRIALISGTITFITLVPAFWIALGYIHDHSTRGRLTKR
jgi:hypothetical protein